ncbi:hypothetical protein [Chroococcus sp. FPU101]|uniref:hypothetical protein n=1 Tax=Chroococcus sp. FPU101 TaxID=1974212 RepID=UPI001A8D65BC|nr:hypothetical protein [Chroococcus sp. FPU101]GFE69062.1 hypothetical protein CFPU101_16720 [Chroococcus sp. FPU101]
MTLKIVSVKKKELLIPEGVEERQSVSTLEISLLSVEENSPVNEQSNTSNEPETESSVSSTESAFFQAIGMIKADSVKLVEKRLVVTIGEKEYRGYVKAKQFPALCRFLEEHGEKPLYLKVYPKTFMAPSHPLELQGWQIIAWRTDLPENEKVNQFVIKGVWQFVPQSRTPVITIYRNHQSNDPTGRYKAAHLPIVMRRDDYQPFRFNPKSTEQSLRYFIQGLFRFDSTRNCFLWKSDLASPTERIPRYRKPCKEPPVVTTEQYTDKNNKKEEKTSEIKEIVSEIINIMLDGKTPELSIKFSQKPELPAQGKTVNLQITGENGIIVKATIARKTLAKQVEKMESFENWIAVLSGKMVAINPDGVVELEGAGINVFEKKAKAEEEVK